MSMRFCVIFEVTYFSRSDRTLVGPPDLLLLPDHRSCRNFGTFTYSVKRLSCPHLDFLNSMHLSFLDKASPDCDPKL